MSLCGDIDVEAHRRILPTVAPPRRPVSPDENYTQVRQLRIVAEPGRGCDRLRQPLER